MTPILDTAHLRAEVKVGDHIAAVEAEHMEVARYQVAGMVIDDSVSHARAERYVLLGRRVIVCSVTLKGRRLDDREVPLSLPQIRAKLARIPLTEWAP